MQYLGGKSRIANRIAAVIAAYWNPGMTYVEPFIGAGSVTVAVAKLLPDAEIHASDIHPDLILMWQALQVGWQPPSELDETFYQQLKHEKSSALRGFAGFGCAFGGDWFHGYAKNTRKDRYAEQSRNSLLKKISFLRNTSFSCSDYRSLNPSNSLVYCDPPYANTAKYSNSFDHVEFWSTMRKWSERNVVIVSEYTAPSDFNIIHSFTRNQELRTGGVERKLVTEKLFSKSALAPPRLTPSS